MITLTTGLPGNGKTLFTLKTVKDKAESENRPVFYSGITDLALDWTEIEPERWFECPEGAIIVIDECQRVFRPRSMSKDVPEYVSQLETHRHKGFDIYLITQHPMLVDNAVRRLAGQHYHVMRKFGMESARIHEWNVVKQDCDKPHARKDSNKKDWKFDKSIYQIYKSAEVHTVKRNIPKHVYVLGACVVLVLIAGGYMWHWTQKKKQPKPETTEVKKLTSSTQGSVIRTSAKAFDPRADAREYAFKNTPRVAGLPHTAPKYDKLTEPTRVPVPSMCIQSKSKCLCYSQQATRMDIAQHLCYDFVRKGFFEEFDPNGNANKGEQQAQNQGARRLM